MPHLTIEHSANLGSRVDLAALVRQLHEAVLATGIFPEKGLRTRVASRDEYRIADGDAENAFLHLVLRIGSGREEVALKRAGDGIFAALCEATAGADAAFVESCRRVFDAIDADRGGSLSRYL